MTQHTPTRSNQLIRTIHDGFKGLTESEPFMMEGELSIRVCLQGIWADHHEIYSITSLEVRHD